MKQTLARLQKQFLQPSDEFTPVPFWFWNDELTEAEILRQIADFRDKGVMGFVIHPRIGLPEEIVYLSDRFMDLVETAVAAAQRYGMTVILYDEAMYPSGSAKGYVVRDHPEYASRGLQMREYACTDQTRIEVVLGEGDRFVSAQAIKKVADGMIDPQETMILPVIDGHVSFTPPTGSEKWSIVLFIEIYSKGHIRGVHFGEDDGEPHAPSSVDLLNPDAVRSFIQITYDRYYERLHHYFGNTVVAFFTDEPSILGRGPIKGLKPWTRNFLDEFIESGNEETDLSLLWYEIEGQAGKVRSAYSQAVHRRLTQSYYKQLHDWCEQHHIALTGHPDRSDDIGILEYFQIPGQDLVWRWVAPEDDKSISGTHSTLGKCASDAARHRGRRRNLNECLGVCAKGAGWGLTGDDMKWYLDWLFVRGANMISPHAFYYSIRGDRRRNERPPDVGPNNIWWPHYALFSTYMKRMSWLMTDSVNRTSVAVLCSGESLPWRIVRPLYEQQVEFNYLEEQLLLDRCRVEDGEIRIAAQSYRVLLVEGTGEWSSEVTAVLKTFLAQGGTVITWDPESSLAESAMLGLGSLSGVRRVEDAADIVPLLARTLPVDVVLSPSNADIRVSHVVKEGIHFYLLVNEGDATYEGYVHLNTVGNTQKWNPWKGTIAEQSVMNTEYGIGVSMKLARRESVIYCVTPTQELLLPPTDKNFRLETEVAASDWVIVDIKEQGEVDQRELVDGLSSWTEWAGMDQFSGTVTYEGTFIMDSPTSGAAKEVTLDLGVVHELAEVWVNDRYIGVSMWAPYIFDVGEAVCPGINSIRVAVTNSLANRYDGAQLPSGLMGPVVVKEYIEEGV